MKYLALIANLFLGINISLGQGITLSDIPLTWANFRIVEVKNPAYAAHVDTWISYNISLDTVDGNIQYLLSTECYINNANSVVTRQFHDEANAMEKERCLRHEKGHFVIGLIQQKKFHHLLEGYRFQNPLQKEIDSLFSLTINEMTKINRQYDQATDHGRNGAQDQWENNLMQQLNELYSGSDFSTAPIALRTQNSTIKITDPANFRYPRTEPDFDYKLYDNRIPTAQFIAQYPITISTPYHAATDSTIYFENIDFSRDFEAEFIFSFKNKIDKYTPGAVFGWAVDSSSLNTGVSIAPLMMKYFGLHEPVERKRKNDKFIKTYKNDLRGGPHVFSIRKLGSVYCTFVDGHFDKEFIHTQPVGSRLFIFVVKQIGFVHGIKFYYL